MGKYYLAIDIGASGGRHMLASLEEGRIRMEEIYRFPNELEKKDGSLCWKVDRLFKEILTGLKKCGETGKIPSFAGIATWGVDFVLLDKDDHILGNTVGYRDSRTTGMDEKVYEVISPEELYERTGIQKQIFNTVYQLMAVKQEHPEYMEQAESMLMMPDYFNFLLTGEKKMEYTNATTGQLVNVETNDWDYELIDRLGYNKKMFRPVSMPGTLVGRFLPWIREEVGYDCEVILPATHDTGSAVLAVPASDDGGVYISSGTWSLMGVEREKPDCSMESMNANFTNEGGYAHRFRFLKNIMGLWMIQSAKKEFLKNFSFADLCELADGERIASLVDCNDSSFLAPPNMCKAVQEYCAKTSQQIPVTEGEISAVIYNSLAKCYADTVAELEKITGKSCDTIYVVGGGSNAVYLNRLTAEYTKKKVMAGPSEATAIGNILVQMLHEGELSSLQEAREVVRKSFEIEEYKD